MKIAEKKQIIGAHDDIEKANMAFRLLKERLQLDRDDLMTDKTILRLISEKKQMIYLVSVIDEYLSKAKKTIKACVR